MTHIIVALSGPVGSGKTTLARGLLAKYDATHFSTRDLLRERSRRKGLGDLVERGALQRFGDELDIATGGDWVASDLEPLVNSAPRGGVIVIDAVRRPEQLDALRRVFGRRVTHVHVETTSMEELERRYSERRVGGGGPLVEMGSYDEVRLNPTEAHVDELAELADVVLDTFRNTAEDVLVRCAARLGLLPPLGEPLVDVLVGGEYGSEGKGNIAFYLAPEYDVLVRVGGPNAGHKVPFATSYTHRSLPSGTLSSHAATLIIGPGAIINIEVLLKEIAECDVAPERLNIDPQAMIITNDDIEAERELMKQIGSTGQGVGAATARRVLGRSSGTASALAGSVSALAPYIRPTHEVLDDAFSKGARILLEGTQGTGLSIFHGQYPYVTSRDTTVSGTLSEAGISPRRVRRVVMVCRTYPIRVGGNSGPIGQSRDITWDEIARRSGIDAASIDERGSVSGKVRRVAEFDWLMLRRSAEINGATDVALTFADYLDARNREAYRYDQLQQETIRFVEEVEQVAGAPVSLIATNFHQRSVIDRRDWRGRMTT